MTFKGWARRLALALAVCSFSLNGFAQQSPAVGGASTSDASTTVPGLINYSGVLADVNGKPLTGVTGVTFLLYKDAQGGTAVWTETQNVVPSKNGQYNVSLGAVRLDRSLAQSFTNGEPRWLGIQVGGQPEQPRVILVTVPYAMKAADAETIGGLPASAFVLANSAQANASQSHSTSAPASTIPSAGKLAPPVNPTVTGKGTAGNIPLWDTTSDIVNSVMVQKGALIGIGTTTPAATLDVNGKGAVRDTLNLFPKGTDNTLAVSGTTFKVSSTGKVTFITGQTFPGTGTITGITTASGSGLSGGGTTGTLSLKVAPAGVTNAMLQNSKITLNANTAGGLTVPGAMTLGSTFTIGLKPCSANQILQFSGTTWNCSNVGSGGGTITGVTAGTDLTGGGTTGNVTLNLDTTKVPQLAAANTFTNNQAIAGSSSGFGLTITQPNQLGVLVQGPETGVGAAVDLLASGSGGVQWEILDTGAGSSQGANKLNIRNVSAGLDVMTITAGGLVGIGTTQPNLYKASIIPPDAATDSGLGGSPGLYSQGSAADTNGILAGGTGIVAAGGTGGAGNVSGNGGDAMDAFGGFGQGGNGGIGLKVFGGFSNAQNGGAGVVAMGGDSGLFFGGDGVDATGGAGGQGNSFSSTSGNGITAVGGQGGFEEADGTGGIFTGGSSAFGGFGIEAFGGSDAAAFFEGDIIVTGAVDASIKDFKIDHPTDPANKYLYHASVESSEMMNLYTGNVTTDAQGDAQIQLPDWFEAINTDFRYQLTVIGQFAQAIVSSKISGNHFAIKTDKPNVEVSWQVTGVRQDAFAKAHPLIVEQDKNEHERGFYLNPELYGAPAEKGIAWAHHPQTMKKMQQRKLEMQQKQKKPGLTASAKR